MRGKNDFTLSLETVAIPTFFDSHKIFCVGFRVRVPDKTGYFCVTKSQLSSILIKYFVSKNGNQWEFFVDGSVCKTGAFMAFFSTKIRLVDNANICFRVYVKLYQYRNNKSIKYSSNRCRKTTLTRMLCGENSRKLSNFLTLTASAFSIAFDGPTSCSPDYDSCVDISHFILILPSF